jgi:hypothetical protein
VGVAVRSGKGPTGQPGKEGSRHAVDGYRIHYERPADSIPEAELNLLAAVYRFVLDHYQEHDDAATNGTEGSDERAE